MTTKTLGQVARMAHDKSMASVDFRSVTDAYRVIHWEAVAQAVVDAYVAGQWMDIETAPKDGTQIVVGYGRQSGFPVKVVFYDKLRNYWSHYGTAVIGLEANATRWMSLPPPPAAEVKP